MTRLITDHLDSAALACPNKPAFVDERRTLTFAALRHEARCVAAALLERGLCRKPVALYLPNCVECVACFLGTAQSGNFFSLLDANLPSARVRQTADILQPGIILTDAAHADKARAAFECDILVYEQATARAPEALPRLPDREKIFDEDPLCVLFTSGSTGTPKGVLLSRGGFAENLKTFSMRWTIDESHIVALLSPLFHILGIQNSLISMTNRCTAHIFSYKNTIFCMEFLKYILNNNINTIFCVPTTLKMLASSGLFEGSVELLKLKKIFFCGEYIQYDTVMCLKKYFYDCSFIHQYGFTETGGACTGCIVEWNPAIRRLPIGTRADTNLFVLNADNSPAEPEEIGEICARGPCLASGYYRNPEQTAEVFIQNPLHSDPEIIYRTGDLGYYNDKGELFYAGRKDMQIKHQGYRIEPGDIEAAALAAAGVRLACCIYDHERTMPVLFYTGDAERLAVIRSLKQSLPSYMVPRRVERLDSMPLVQSGKLDRQTLRSYL